MFPMGRLRFWLQNEPHRLGYGLYIGMDDDNGHSVVQPLEFKLIPDGTMLSEPTLMIKEEEAQALLEELWRAGLRPAEGFGTMGQIGAVQEHLKDMRQIAFKTLKINKP